MANKEDRVPLAVEREIDRLCREFERAWQAGQKPQIEGFLKRASAEARPHLLRELIAQEVDLRQSSGEAPEPSEYHLRFSQFVTEVDQAFSLLDDARFNDRTRPHADQPVAASTVSSSEDPSGAPGDDYPDAQDPPQDSPKQIGRYQIQKRLGIGTFGCVYLAYDPQLQRAVALKVPRIDSIGSIEHRQVFLQEARNASRLSHPGLVAVYDVQQQGDILYIVQEYIDGQDLGQWAAIEKPGFERISHLISEISEAIGYAHERDLVHRDLKPANILIDRDGHAHVADFGLAIDENLARRRKEGTAGTPPYMSPEQVRGETHLLDGRSDLWSVGVIFYELLTGRRPVVGDSYQKVFEEIRCRDPKPPRMIKPEIPSELERICLKCLAKRQTDRYSSAAELAEDLSTWLKKQSLHATEFPEPTSSAPEPVKPISRPRILPKGLCSFDTHDADFFLELLPGPRDRSGLPDSIRFWKTRIEDPDPENTFRVGLMYGPSGCGKTSLVKAGLLPRLAPQVTPIYVESTPDDTEARLLRKLQRRIGSGFRCRCW